MLYKVACLTAVLNSIFIKPTPFTNSNLNNVAHVCAPFCIIKTIFPVHCKAEINGSQLANMKKSIPDMSLP